MPNSNITPQVWKYCETDLGEGWSKIEYNDSDWKDGLGGFGTRFGKEAIIKTEWKNTDIWLKKEFTLEEIS